MAQFKVYSPPLPPSRSRFVSPGTSSINWMIRRSDSAICAFLCNLSVRVSSIYCFPRAFLHISFRKFLSPRNLPGPPRELRRERDFATVLCIRQRRAFGARDFSSSVRLPSFRFRIDIPFRSASGAARVSYPILRDDLIVTNGFSRSWEDFIKIAFRVFSPGGNSSRW